MLIEDGKFYFIKDEFFDVFKKYKLMENKENGNKRPCYFCFKERRFYSFLRGKMYEKFEKCILEELD